ncbi:hypothetical protein B9Z55_007839 [Caenorhabditis nigoni]|uniref:BTB domain-containing protein n=1 Tax=Caenorhabditis nigoni TaxID=1611254 RepID=A0A2G5VBH8_9PELO|nr:hypothetical protein B9Z55_007839 [Caenorhabditis nigoni]
MTDLVKLNVGGTIFQTSKSTLTKFDGFFKTLLETGISVTKDDSDAVFIDRSPKNFEKVLDFMRDGDVALPESPENVKEIQKEAQFYLLEGLVKLCISKPEVQKKSFLVDSNDELGRFIAESKKNAVLVVFYESGRDTVSEIVAKALMLCGDKVDVCFKPCEEKQWSGCIFHDKINNQTSNGVDLNGIRKIISSFIGNSDNS